MAAPASSSGPAGTTDVVDWARITVLVENQTDMLLPSDPARGIERFGLIEHFRPPHGKVVCTENGIAYWVETRAGDEFCTVLFDTGLTGDPCLHNVDALGLDLDKLDAIVISHAHPDHYGGLSKVLSRIARPIPVVVHPDAFLKKVLIDDLGEEVLTVNRGFEREIFQELGADLVESRTPFRLASGLHASGEIPRVAPFEPPVPTRTGRAGLFLLRDGAWVSDEAAIDDQALIVHVRGSGLVVLTACGHSGIVNTLRYAQNLSGESRIAAVMGGFHLGFPGVPSSSLKPTVDALTDIAPDLIAPIHCSGFAAQKAISDALPDAYVQYVVGTKITFGQ